MKQYIIAHTNFFHGQEFRNEWHIIFYDPSILIGRGHWGIAGLINVEDNLDKTRYGISMLDVDPETHHVTDLMRNTVNDVLENISS